MPRLTIYETCSHCDSQEERIFTDSWTGKEFCLQCIHDHRLVDLLTNSPQSEGDNLDGLMKDDT